MSTLMHELPQRHRITVEHFYRMAEVGLFAEDERVELIEGEIIDVPPMGHRHAGVVDYLAKLLMSSLGARAIVRPQLPLRLGEDSEPLPDIVVAKPRDDLYFDAHPTAADVAARRRSQQHDASIRSQRQGADVRAARRSRSLGLGRGRCSRFTAIASPNDGKYASTTTVPLATRMTLDALECEIDLRSLAARLAEAQET